MVHWQLSSEIDNLLIQGPVSNERSANMHSVQEAVHFRCEVRNEEYRLAEKLSLTMSESPVLATGALTSKKMDDFSRYGCVH